MKINWFIVLTMALLLVLIASAGCLSATPTTEPVAASPTYTPSTEPAASNGLAPSTNVSQDNSAIGTDPVSGQSEEVDLRWEQLCLSSEYQVQIAKDPGFTTIVLDTGAFAPASSGSPGAYVPSGSRTPSPSSLTGWGNLEAGHTYYGRARVRQAATGQHMLSPWSEVQSFTVKSGNPTAATSYGVQPISPANGQTSNPIKPVPFNWTPMTDSSKYRFVLATDPAMTQVIVDTEVSTTAYDYEGQLEYSQAYFWRVMPIEPVASDWSATFSFQTEPTPKSAEAAPATPQTPAWAWVVIVVGLILLIAIIVLIFMLRRR